MSRLWTGLVLALHELVTCVHSSRARVIYERTPRAKLVVAAMALPVAHPMQLQ